MALLRLVSLVQSTYVATKTDNNKAVIDANAQVVAFKTNYSTEFSNLSDWLKALLIDNMDDLIVAQGETLIADEIFERLANVPLVDKYEAYQILDDKWQTISTDLEMIKTEGKSAITQVDPNMVLKKKDGKETEVQDGWIGHSKTWDYKGKGGFLPTKNKSSVRKIQIDWQTVVQFSELIKEKPDDEPLFITCKVYNSTVNDVLKRRCKQAHIPTISIHGLRHTHASLLLFAGVTIASVARRLGHSSMTTTQKTYLHIIHELENKDIDLVMRAISSL